MYSDLLYKLYKYRSRRLRTLVLSLIKRCEGGDFYSVALRRIFAGYHNIEVGMYSYGCFDISSVPAGTTIGRYCSFAKGFAIMNANHPLDRLSLHPFFYNDKLGIVKELEITRGSLVIGHDVWIGRNALILPGVNQIGNGAVVGAGAVVTKDVPPYAVVAGNPAKVIKYRFEENLQEAIERSAWWDYEVGELQKKCLFFVKPLSSTILSQIKSEKKFQNAYKD